MSLLQLPSGQLQSGRTRQAPVGMQEQGLEVQAHGQPARKASEALSDKDPGEGPHGGRRGAARGLGNSVRTKDRRRR